VDPSRAWAFLATRVNEMVVALDRGEVVGGASGTVLMQPDKPTAFQVSELVVHHDVRRQGIGTRLFERISDLARDRGCEDIWIAVNADNDGALSFCRSLGVTAVGGIVHFRWQ
jgi:GNAT superfamily N-acetyltransferase